MELSWDNVLLAFALTLFAGLSTGIGSAIAFLTKKTNKKFLSLSLGFSAGVMIYVSFVEIFPTTWYIYLLGAVMLCVMLLGAWKLGKQRWFAIGYIAATLGVISIFSTPSGNRYITSVLPFLTAFLLIGLWWGGSWLIQRKWKEKALPAYVLLLLLFFAKSGLQEEHLLAQQKYPVNYQQFFAIGKSLKKNTSAETIVCSRKPQMLYMYSERPGVNYAYTDNAEALIADLVKKKVDLVLVDALGYSSTYRYLIPAIQNYPQFFPRALAYYENTGTYLLVFDRQAAEQLSENTNDK